MILCADIGNSSIKLAAVDEEGLHHHEAVPVSADAVALAVAARNITGRAEIDAVAICSVVPSKTEALGVVLGKTTGHEPWLLTADARFPFLLDVSNPADVGTDRLAAAVAGVAHSGGDDVIIVDIGSAVTVDLVASWTYRGGAIFAGPQTALDALAGTTAQLPRLSFDPRTDAGTGATEDALQFGATVALIGAVREAVSAQAARCDGDPAVVYGGGGSEAFDTSFPASWCHEPSLVLKGLYALFQSR